MSRHVRRRVSFLALILAGLCAAAVARAMIPVSFAPHLDYATGGGPYGVMLGDLNGDGHLDAVVGNNVDGTVSVLLGDGHGGFTLAHTLVVGAGPYPGDLADVNGDGRLDLAMPCTTDGSTWVFFGDGAGGFGPPAEYPSPWPAGAKFVDLNHDGVPDLVVTGSNCADIHTVTVRLGLGDGTFGDASTYDVCGCPTQVVVADVDQDGNPDLVLSGFGAGFTVLFGDGAGGFPARWDCSVDQALWGGAAVDLDGDGIPDLVGSAGYGHLLYVWRGLGGRSFGPLQSYPTAGGSFLAMADVNLDGKVDAITSNEDHVVVTLGNGDGTFGASTAFPAAGDETWSLAIGDVDGDGRPDVVTGDYDVNRLSVLLNATARTQLAPQSPGACITPAQPCVEVPVTIVRSDATPIRGISVTLQLAGGLAVCPPGVIEGGYLSGMGTTNFEVVDHHDGSYTVDDVILGAPCGATAASGTVFTLHLGSGEPAGTGAVTIDAVSVRSCGNAPLDASAGGPAAIPIDNVVPGAVALAAAPQASGNDADGTTRIDLSWTGSVPDGDSVLVYRAPYGDYPEYGSGGEPAAPPYPPATPWALVGSPVAPAASLVDEPSARDFWYYAAFVKDACGNVSAVSNRTGGTLDYLLGDVSNGSTPCQGNNQVYTEDISLLGAHYGIALTDPDTLGCLDVGPTTDYSVAGRPVPDDRLDFEDLMIYAMNYAAPGSKPPASGPPGPPAPPAPPPKKSAQPVVVERDELWLEAPATVAAGEPFTVTLHARGAGDLQGISTQLAWAADVAQPVAVAAGELLADQAGVALSGPPGRVDVALLGARRALAGEGVLATVTFQARASGAPQVAIASIDARDVRNHRATLGTVQPATPTATAFAPAMPNPFDGQTTLGFALARAGVVSLVIYGVDGRRITTLAGGPHDAGDYRVVWDGRGGDGQPARPGLYYARLVTPQGTFTRALVLRR